VSVFDKSAVAASVIETQQRANSLRVSEAARHADRLAATKTIDALQARKPEVIYVQTNISDSPCVDAAGLLTNTASINRAIAGALPASERGPYEETAARADTADGALCYSDLLNRDQLLTALLADATNTAHGLQDFVREVAEQK